MGELDTSSSKLFTPIKIGSLPIQHRIVLAPLTRFRSTKKGHVPLDIVREYYTQRADTPGTFMITEATFIAEEAGGFDHVPGIYSEEQIQAWRKVTEAIHARGCFIFLQLWALGGAAVPGTLKEDGHPHVSSSPTPLENNPAPRELTKEEIKKYVGLYVQAAENGINAGFDGIEIHCAHGYLVDQFIQEGVNKRTDEYGGSIETRSRFALEIVEAVSKRIGMERTAVRLSPWNKSKGMGTRNVVLQFSYLINELAAHYRNLAYIHITEPRVSGHFDVSHEEGENLEFAREIWRQTGRPFLVTGGYTPDTALTHFNIPGRDNDAIAFGRHFISNPDLVTRIRNRIPLNTYDRSTFYTPEATKGYLDYPFSDEVNVP